MAKNDNEKAQFLHVETYSKMSSNKGGKKKYKTEVLQTSINGVLGEAQRLKTYCKHITAPQLPKLLYGSDLKEVKKLTEEYYKNAVITLKNGKKRAVRSDSNCMLAGVISVPANFKNWQEYKNDAIKWLKNKYGNNLKSVIEHTDEPCNHLHYYCVLRPDQKMHDIHDGLKSNFLNDKLPAAEKMKLYKEEMEKMQNNFYTAVSKKYGLLRISEDPRARNGLVTSAEYKKIEIELNNAKNELKDSKKIIENYKKQGYEIGKKQGIAIAAQDFEENNILSKIKIVKQIGSEKNEMLESENKLLKLKNEKLLTKKEEYKNAYKHNSNLYKKQKIEFEKIKEKNEILKKTEERNIELEEINLNLSKKNNEITQEFEENLKELNSYKSFFETLTSNYNTFCNNSKKIIGAAINKFLKKSEQKTVKIENQKNEEKQTVRVEYSSDFGNKQQQIYKPKF